METKEAVTVTADRWGEIRRVLEGELRVALEQEQHWIKQVERKQKELRALEEVVDVLNKLPERVVELIQKKNKNRNRIGGENRARELVWGVLDRVKPSGARELEEVTGIPYTTVSRILNQLEREGRSRWEPGINRSKKWFAL